jgi:hypothetical protein
MSDPLNVLKFQNDGPQLLSSNYWTSEMAAAGRLYVTINPGCFRLLIPQRRYAVISDMRHTAKHIVSQYCREISGSIASIASNG